MIAFLVCSLIPILVQKPMQSTIDYSKSTILEIQFSGISHGIVDILLHVRKAPLACHQIERLTNTGFYNRQKVFKVINLPKPFLVQMGDPLTKQGLQSPEVGTKGSGQRVPYEDSGYHMIKGAVALATLPGKPNSGDSQFFILLGDYHNLLDHTATVFGQVIKGMSVVENLHVGDEIDSARIIAPHS